MPHGTIRLGSIEVTALCDAATPFPRPLAETFPDVPNDAWPELRRRYPETLHGDDGWLFHVHCYLVRAAGLTILVDAGLGPAWTIAATWVGVEGDLPGELERLGVAPGDVDLVAITHLHLDHIGWGVEGQENPRPTFANARYLINRTEWEGFRELGDEDDIAAFEQQAVPLDRAGVLDLVDGDRNLCDGVTLVPTPGHTPGHQSVLIEAGDRRALLSGDLTNHPAQVTEPLWRSAGDMDPSLASWTRRRWLDRVVAEDILLCTAHYPQPFGRVTEEGGRRFFAPEQAETASAGSGSF
jgi:glyoxylase-like metal-dependent hydrolase (beta-lactamase superfamily II)